MGAPFSSWYVRDAFGTIELELYPDAVDDAAREASLRELKKLAFAFTGRQPDVRRVVLAIYARLWGRDAGAFARRPEDDPGYADHAIAEELLIAARAGSLVARRRNPRPVVMPLDGAPEEVLGPDPSHEQAPASKNWVGIVLVDQDGAPVAGRPYRIVKPDGTTMDGTLDSNGTAMIGGLDPGSCQIWCPYVEPHPEATYEVKDGDHISGIAQSHGFDDYKDVWNHPDNADLRQQRTDPHVLQPGDSVAIPEVKAQAAANKPTGAKHTFQIQQSPLKLRIKLLDLSVKSVAGVQVTVAGSALTTDGDGLVEATVDKSATDTPFDSPSNPEVHLSVGDLNPSDDASDSGYKARLYNLGFLWDPTVDDADDEMVIALQDFQAQYSLTMSGALDDATKAQLLEAHGC
jgi:N-acetylmuramoyl-L-alanine amidase